ncbi:MAG: RagB/SusD family nutrient uptake outer membrane protein [Cyclobacteriaceae bacterium]|nr:MAG: RagB/SusD family nutrient uptake outer membrane protein [Cyclobacteriaceae bacterium]
MKTKYIIIIFFASVLTSCNDFFDAPSKSSLDESVIFSTPSLAQETVNSVLIPMMETNSYRGRFLPMYGMNTDVEWHNNSQTISGASDLATYNALANNDQMNLANSAWAMMFSGIERANLCIRGLRTYGNPTSNRRMGELLATALTYRAIYYADLIKAWGDVPERFEPITSETLYKPKVDRDLIYNQLLKDLEEAAALASWPNESENTATVEQINKAFVKGLRARIALAAAGYSQRPDGIRKGQLPDFTEQQLYQIALQECTDVIESGKAHLEPTFEGLWRKYNQEVLAAGGESLWEIPFSDGRGRMLFTFAVRHQNAGDQYHNNGSNRGGVAGPLPHVFYDYDAMDARRDVTCVPYRYGTTSGTIVSPINGLSRPFAKQELVGLNTWFFGKYRYEWMNRFVDNSNDDGVNKMYMRYAEVLLMAAEAAYFLGQEGVAKDHLKTIRRRAFPASEHATKVDAYVNALSGVALFNAIVDEHKFEFCGEMERKQALIRWNLLKEKLDEAKEKMDRLRNRTGEYADVPANVYYKYAADGETLQLYGFNRGETANPGGDYIEFVTGGGDPFVRPGAISDDKINTIYRNDPDTKQLWPIFQVFIDASNGTLVNDYGY